MSVFPGDPLVHLQKVKIHTIDGCTVTNLCLGTHSGTHVDMPLHHLEDGLAAERYPLETFIGQAVTVAVEKDMNQPIVPDDLSAADIRKNDILLISTGWDRHFGTPRFWKDFPYFAKEIADFCIDKEIKCIGCDMPSVDPVNSGAYVHHALLSKKIGIIESLANIRLLVNKRVFFAALPLKIEQGDGSPVRAAAIELNDFSASPTVLT
jgi:kynurenine formamidase